MTAAEHLDRAIWLADLADKLLTKATADGTPFPEAVKALEGARTAAVMAEARTAIHRELWIAEGDPIPLWPEGPRPVAAVLDLPTGTRTAAPEAPGTAAPLIDNAPTGKEGTSS